jgi:hypothetical protein
MKEITTPPTTGFKIPGKKIETKNGYFINFHGTFFFTDKKISERHPWRLTVTKGYLPNPQEWNRLQKEYGLTPIPLSSEEEAAASQIAKTMEGDPLEWLNKEESRGYTKKLLGKRFILKKRA